MSPSRHALPWPLFGRDAWLQVEVRGGRISRVAWGRGRRGFPGLPPRLERPFRAYLAGRTRALDALPVDLAGLTPFRRRVLDALRRVRAGSWTSYARLASAAGRPGAARAVGQALRANPVPLVLPCHRVLASGGRIGGYTPGPALKRRLLAHEGIRLDPIRHPTTIRLRRVHPQRPA